MEKRTGPNPNAGKGDNKGSRNKVFPLCLEKAPPSKLNQNQIYIIVSISRRFVNIYRDNTKNEFITMDSQLFYKGEHPDGHMLFKQTLGRRWTLKGIGWEKLEKG